MRIFVASGFEALSLYAHAINTVKMAQGFASLGHQVTLLCWQPMGRVANFETLRQVYGLNQPIRWLLLPQKNLWCDSNRKSWSLAVTAGLVAILIRPQLIFCRNYLVPWLTSRMGFQTVGESHAPPGTDIPEFWRMVQATHHPKFKLWVTISHRLAEHYSFLGVPPEKLLVLPDAVDLIQFQRPEQLSESPYVGPGPHVAYVGHLYDYKGIPTVLDAAALLPQVQFHLVGGLPEDLIRQQAYADALCLTNITFHGLKPQMEVPPFLWHADALLLPPSAKHPSAAWTSPVKLGEYLASGTPVVATDIPALRDWLTEDEVAFVAPDNAEAMVIGIKRILNSKAYAVSLSEKGLIKAQRLSYRHRAAQILARLDLKQ